ncbi:uncharacterized protein PAC_14210 [Phialocephala subalpina]|uniref:Uncharacterized protein n=1 Tax=Phialocephala subalpina TaxID=576137 RepID=A0A1L7XH15_9HELO|nr:uncharacterized protein PAC_14210 [Phialocephala subalpina]
MVPSHTRADVENTCRCSEIVPREIEIAYKRRNAAQEAVRATHRIDENQGLENDAKKASSEKLREALADIAIYLSILNSFANIQAMVDDETKPGWDWKKGLRAQLDERNVIYALVGGLSIEADKTFLPAARAVNTL